MSELAKTFEDVFPMPCVWCGKPIGSHSTDGKRWVQCGAEVKELLEDSARLAVRLGLFLHRPHGDRPQMSNLSQTRIDRASKEMSTI